MESSSTSSTETCPRPSGVDESTAELPSILRLSVFEKNGGAREKGCAGPASVPGCAGASNTAEDTEAEAG